VFEEGGLFAESTSCQYGHQATMQTGRKEDRQGRQKDDDEGGGLKKTEVEGPSHASI
jgi:hypothetical protein